MPDDDQANMHHAHRHFAGDCFNQVWTYLDKPDRSADDNLQMIHLAHASLWHWTQRSECTSKNLSIGYWLLSRVYATAGEATAAQKYGALCLELVPKDQPYFMGYGHEALARAAKVAGQDELMQSHLSKARVYAEQVDIERDKQTLMMDLAGLK